MAGVLALLRKLIKTPSFAVARYPVHVLLFIRLFEELFRHWARRQTALRDVMRIRRESIAPSLSNTAAVAKIDTELLQGCIFSTENLESLGRVEKRTLFSRSLLELLGGNVYLTEELLRAARTCGRKGSNCLVPRWMHPDARYSVLQAMLNQMSTLIGPSYVHFSALQGEVNGLYKSSWYCLTVMMPSRPENSSKNTSSSPSRRGSREEKAELEENSTFTDLSRTPRDFLCVVLVNEAEIRQIAAGKLKPPAWGFFNSRQAKRWRMLVDFAKNFQTQLVRTSADSRFASSNKDSRSPFTNEHVHDGRSPLDRSRSVRDRYSRNHASAGSGDRKMRRIESSPFMPIADSQSQGHVGSAGSGGDWRGTTSASDIPASFSGRGVASSSAAEISSCSAQRSGLRQSFSLQGLAAASESAGSSRAPEAGVRLHNDSRSSFESRSNLSSKNVEAAANAASTAGDGVDRRRSRRDGEATEPNCFLRLHVPHYVGRKPGNRDKNLTAVDETSPPFVITAISGSDADASQDQDFGLNQDQDFQRQQSSSSGPGPKWM